MNCLIIIMFFFFNSYYTYLYHASENGNYGIVKVLLEHPEIDVNKRSILLFFFTYNDIYKELKWSLLFFNIQKTALHVAIIKRRLEIVQLLLSHDKIDVNCPLITIKSF